jgi:hypothetical protein
MFGMNATFSATANRLFAKHVSTTICRSEDPSLPFHSEDAALPSMLTLCLFGRWRCV